MRALAIAIASLLLSACNVVLSERPLFTQADAERPPRLRDGQWISLTAECQARWTDPAAPPPDCVEHGEVRNGQLLAPGEPPDTALVAGGGDPLIVQIRFSEKDAGTGKPFTVHLYGALKPTRTDPAGRVIEVRRWLVLCGPPPPEAKGSSLRMEEHLTRSPMPGMRVDRKLGVCFARDARAVRRAAAASEAWDEDKGVARWVGDAPATPATPAP